MSNNEFIIPKQSNDAKLRQIASIAGLSSVRVINFVNPYAPEITDKVSFLKDEPVGFSSLGTPVYTDLTLMGMKWTDNITGREEECPNDRFRSGAKSAVTNTPQKGGFYMNLDTVLIVTQFPKRIIKTEIQGRDGTVKEYIGADDAQITINGMITGKNGVYPRDEVYRLRRWLDAPVAKGIVSWYMDNLGISNLVIEGYDMPQTMGGYSFQAFTISAVSDVPVELKITQPIQ